LIAFDHTFFVCAKMSAFLTVFAKFAFFLLSWFGIYWTPANIGRVPRALIVVDVQNDFCPGGSLTVPNGDQVVPVFNQIRDSVHWDGILLTQDWHPANHVSFAVNHNATEFSTITLPNGSKQVMWPTHCVQGSKGAQFRSDLIVKNTDVIVQKGSNPNVDSYSGFFDNDGKSQTELDAKLKEKNIKAVFIGGLALDVCVTYTCLDAKKLGYDTYLVLDASRGLGEAQNAAALDKLRAAGVQIIESKDIH
jgi:nicotinamidase/pyrazinamidase